MNPLASAEKSTVLFTEERKMKFMGANLELPSNVEPVVFAMDHCGRMGPQMLQFLDKFVSWIASGNKRTLLLHQVIPRIFVWHAKEVSLKQLRFLKRNDPMWAECNDLHYNGVWG